MVSPQEANLGIVNPELVRKRDDKYDISTEDLKCSRAKIVVPEMTNPFADYWKKTYKGFAIDVEQTEMKLRAPFP